jgi:alcohol dehydrogenase
VGAIEELSGEMFDLAGDKLHVGDRVVWSVAISCNRCFFCSRGLPQKCESLRKYGHEPFNSTTPPLGGLTTHCHLLPGTAVVKVPPELPDSVAAPAGCATATIAAAWRVGLRDAGVEIRSASPPAVVLIGLGMLGLTACAFGTANGYKVIACDVNESRLQQAKQFGASHTATPATLLELVRDLNAGRGADLVLEMSGSPEAVKLSLDSLRIGGTAVWVGSVFPTGTVSVLPEQIVRRCLTVTGIHNYSPRDLADAIAFLATSHSRFPFADLATRTFPLDSVTEAFEFAERERPIRVAIDCR